MDENIQKIKDWINSCTEYVKKFISQKNLTLYRYQKFDRSIFLSTIDGHIKVTDPKLFNDLYDGDLMIGENYLSTALKSNDLLYKSFRVASFSTIPVSILMWSHYADCNRGICYCYEVSDISKYINRNSFASIVPVIYEDQPVNIKPLLESFNEINDLRYKLMAIAYRIICKHKVWSYEKEVRLCIQLNKLMQDKIINFGQSVELYNFMKPNSVILGAKFSDEDLKFVRDNFTGNIYKIKQNLYEYQLSYEKLN